MTTVELIIEASETYNSYDFAKWINSNKENLRGKEKQQIIDTAIEFGNHGTEMMQQRGEEYYKLISKL